MDGAFVTGVSTFDVLYNTMKLDPNALAGMGHLHRAQSFDNLGDLMDFMKSNIINSEPGEAAWEAMVHKYKGYTGEEGVAEYYRERGHDVEIPDSGTNEGWDLKIDGEAFNTKFTDDPRYIQEHLDNYPDINVIAPREMAEAFRDNPRVEINPALSSQGAFDRTEDTLEGIEDLGDGIDSVPYISLAINTGKNINKLRKGEIDYSTAAEHTALDTAATGFGGWLGGTVGLGWGLALAPVTGGISTVVLPVLGSLAGIFTGKGITDWFKERHLRNAIEELEDLATRFRDSFLDMYQTILDEMDSYFEEHFITCNRGGGNQGFLKRLLSPNLMTTFYRMASKELKTELRTARRFYSDLREAINDNEEPAEGGMILFANCQEQGVGILYGIDPLPEYYATIENQLEVIEKEQRKLK